MRKLKTEKNIKIDNEAVIRVEIDKINNETQITVASGYLDGAVFVPLEGSKKKYKVKNISEEQEETVYFAEVDKQNSPSLIMYGLLYRARQEGVFIKYISGEALAINIIDSTIEVTLIPLVTTNQEIIDAISVSQESLTLIYEPEVLDLDADVDAPGVPKEIK